MTDTKPCGVTGCVYDRYSHAHTIYCYEHYIQKRSNLPIDSNKTHLNLLAKTGECYDDPQHENANPRL